jgi:hypothetical protein
MDAWSVDQWIQLAGALAGVGTFVLAILEFRHRRRQRPVTQVADSPVAALPRAPAGHGLLSYFGAAVLAFISVLLCGSALVSCVREATGPLFGGYCPDGAPTIPANQRSTYCGYDSDCYNDGCHHV